MTTDIRASENLKQRRKSLNFETTEAPAVPATKEYTQKAEAEIAKWDAVISNQAAELNALLNTEKNFHVEIKEEEYKTFFLDRPDYEKYVKLLVNYKLFLDIESTREKASQYLQISKAKQFLKNL